jgi:hypothetical protein
LSEIIIKNTKATAAEKYGEVNVKNIKLVYLIEKGEEVEPWLIGVEKCQLSINNSFLLGKKLAKKVGAKQIINGDINELTQETHVTSMNSQLM